MNFQRTSQLPLLNVERLVAATAESAPVAWVDAGRPHYLPVDVTDMVSFLDRTKIDRHVWRVATPKDDTVELVCTSFSLLLFGLVEQERLKCGLRFPLAFGRVRLLTHSMCGFVDPSGILHLVEPQSDRLWIVHEYVESRLGLGMPRPEIQSIMFQ